MAAAGERGLGELIAASHSGMTTDKFAQTVAVAGAAKHPKLQRPYTDLVYPPMLELLA